MKIKNYFKSLSKISKINSFIIIAIFTILLIITIPTLANYKKSDSTVTTNIWDGSVASSFAAGNGTLQDPYIISDGSELAYLASQLEIYDYKDTYFNLSSNIVLNEGIIKYDDEGIIYLLDDNTYYLKEYTNQYYDNNQRDGQEVGTINIFPSLDNFNGYLDGNLNSIYGLYITDDKEELGLFTNLSGKLNNLSVKNSLVYGGLITGGIASTTNNATLNNILFDGFVIGKNKKTENISHEINTNEILVESNETPTYIELPDVTLKEQYLVTTTISGEVEISGAKKEEVTLKINGEVIKDNVFEVDLGTDKLSNVEILSSSASLNETKIIFNNLKYNIVLAKGTSGGIVGKSSSFTTVENVINKATVFGNANSGGLFGVVNDTVSINQSYNTGVINTNYIGAGLISIIENSNGNINITKSYNEYLNPSTGGLIGLIENNPGVITLDKLFDASNNYSIGSVVSSSVNITNTYHLSPIPLEVGEVNGQFIQTNKDYLQSNSLITVLAFSEYISEEDYSTKPYNVWIYNEQSYPVLFIDDVNKNIANIYVGSNVFNEFSTDLKKISTQSNITFTVDTADILNPIRDTYFYISNDNIPLSKDELNLIESWELLTDITTLTDEGNYIIYVKTVDYWDRITYINTDLLIIDTTDPHIKINLDEENSWENYKEELVDIYIDSRKNIDVAVIDNLSDIKSIEYYISSTILTMDEIIDLSWSTYEDSITLDKSGNYIVYIKAVDMAENITYANTDILTIDGYDTNLSLGFSNYEYELTNNITNDSNVTINFSYTNKDDIIGNHQHYLISNTLLPLNTKITFIDQTKEKVYVYITNEEDITRYENSCTEEDCIKTASYPFTLFKEIGKLTDSNYQEESYYENNLMKENFTFNLDFSTSDISNDTYNIQLKLKLTDENNEVIRKTITNDNNNFNVYINQSASLNLSSNYSGTQLYLNKDDTNNISFTNILNYQNIEDIPIIDTRFENKHLGLLIKITDINGQVIDKKLLKNIQFKIDEQLLYFEDDNQVRIILEESLNEKNIILTLITKEGSTKFLDNTYYIKINTFTTDGTYEDILSNEINIPLNVIPNNSTSYGFDVTIEDLVINKVNEEVEKIFNINQTGEFINPNIRVSLYKKNHLTAYNQDYTLVDLNSYTKNSLQRHLGYVYYATPGEFKLNFITNKFDYTSYKLIYELYDEDNYISTIKKYLITR